MVGGNANAYDYCTADPINCYDLDGRFGWKKWGHKLGNLASHVAWIPGPIGTAASAVSAAGYAVAEEWGNAAVAAMGVAFGKSATLLSNALKKGRAAGHIGNKTTRLALIHVNGSRSAFGFTSQARPDSRPKYRSRYQHYRRWDTWD